MRRRFPPFLLLACAFTAPVWAVPDPNVTLQPAQPTENDEIVVRIEVPNWIESKVDHAYIRTSQPHDHELYVVLSTTCVLAACPRVDKSFDVPLGRLPAADYGYVIELDGSDLERGSFRVHDAGGEPPPESGSRYSLSTTPAAPAPTDADRIRLAIAAQTPTCASPTLTGVAREGAKFIAELALPDPDPACLPPPGGLLSGHVAELGQLPHGAYDVELRTRRGDQVATVATHTFNVADAGDYTDLLGRYRVSITWETLDGTTGPAVPVAMTSAESALFSFFNQANWEVLVKVLDGCALNGHRWIFLTAATDVEFTLTVTDLQGQAPPYVYTRPAGLFTPPLADTAAFACAP